MRQEKNIFKFPFWPCLWLLFIGNLIGLIFLSPVVVIYLKENFVDWLLFIAIFAAVTDLAVAPIVCQFLKIIVLPETLTAYDCWGLRHTVSWDNMHKIKSINLCGLKYLRVFYGRKRFPLWIPLFFPAQPEFIRVVSDSAPQTNVLRQRLELERK